MRLLVVLVCIVIATEATKLEETKNILFIESDHVINSGITYFEMDYVTLSPCSRFDLSNSSKFPNKQAMRAYSRAQKICNNMYEQSWLTALEYMLKGFMKYVSRAKREVLSAIAGITTIAILLVTTVVSSVRLIYDMKTKISDLDLENKEMQMRTEVLNNKVDRLVSAGQNITNVLNDMNSLAEEMRTNIENIYTLMPELAFDISDEITEMSKSKTYIEEITQTALTHGQFNIEAASKLFRWPELTQYETDQTQILGAHRVDSSKIHLRFSVRLVDQNIRVSKVVSFPHWVDFLDKPRLLRYDGPLFIVHNKRVNCTLGIDEPVDKMIIATCERPNSYDERLNNWVEIDVEDHPVTVFKTNKYSYVCMSRSGLITEPSHAHLLLLGFQ